MGLGAIIWDWRRREDLVLELLNQPFKYEEDFNQLAGRRVTSKLDSPIVLFLRANHASKYFRLVSAIEATAFRLLDPVRSTLSHVQALLQHQARPGNTMQNKKAARQTAMRALNAMHMNANECSKAL